jgi:hypothetical protein
MTVIGKEMKNGEEMCHASYSMEREEETIEVHYYFNNEDPPKVIMEAYKNGEFLIQAK